MRKKNYWKSILLAALVAAVAAGCGSKSHPGANNDPDPDPGTDPTPVATTAIGKAIVGMKANLTAGGLSSAQVDAIASGAQGAVTANGADQDDLSIQLPAATGGAISAMSPLGLSDSLSTRCARIIVDSMVAAMNGQFEATGAARALGSSRAITTDASSVMDILRRIAKAAIENLDASGIVPERRGEVAGAVVATIIGSLDDGGVDKTLVNEAVGGIAKAAVQSLKDAGLSATDALALAVQEITKGAVSALSSVAVPGVEISDYPALTSSIAQSAGEALGSIATSAEDVAKFASALATGASAGIIEVKTAMSTGTEADATLTQMAQSLASGATAGVLKTDFVDAASNGLELIGKITLASSQTLTDATTGLGAGTSDAIISGITAGACAGATAATAASLDQATIGAAIVLEKAGASTTADPADVANGVALATNIPPVANPGEDRTVIAGSPVTLDAGASSDADGGISAYAWKIAQKPAASAARIADAGAAAVTASFTPDAAGWYLISLKVTDTKGAVAESFLGITAKTDNTNVVYNNLTAGQRLDSAKGLLAASDMPAARDELLTILARYPESTLFPETRFLLGNAYRKLKDYPAAIARYEEVISTAPDSAFATKARLALGWLYLDTLTDLANAAVYFDGLAGTADPKVVLEARMASAICDLRTTGPSPAIVTELETTRDSPDATLFVRWESQLGIAEDLLRQNLIADAEAAALRIIDEPAYYCTDKTIATFDAATYFNNACTIFWNYGDLNMPDKQVALFETVRQDQRISSLQRLIATRMLAELYLWSMPDTKDNALHAYNLLNNALPACTGTDIPSRAERALSSLRLANARNDLANHEALSADRKAGKIEALQIFESCENLAAGLWNAASALYSAKVGRCEINLWTLRDYATAESLALAVLSSPQGEKKLYELRARATTLLGHIYRERGYDAENKYGLDPVAYFQKALSYYAKSIPGYFPGLNEHMWYFNEAQEGAASIYAALGNYPLARSSYQKLIDYANSTEGKNEFAPADVAWYQLGLAQTYDREARQLVDQSDVNALTALQNALDAAFDKVGNYTDDSEVSGSAAKQYADNGRIYAEAMMTKGLVYLDASEILRDSGAATATDLQANFNTVISTLGEVTFANFPNLATQDWYFFESMFGVARAQADLEQFATAATICDNIAADIDAGRIEAKRGPGLQNFRGYCHRAEADSMPIGASTDEAGLQAIFNMYDSSRSAYLEVTDLVKYPASWNNGSQAAWGYKEAGYSSKRKMDRLQEYLEAKNPDSDWYGKFSPGLTRMTTLRDQTVTDYLAAAAFKYNGNLPANGRPAAQALHDLGFTYQPYAWFAQQATAKDATPSPDTIYLEQNDLAIDAFKKAAAITTAEPWTILDSKRGQGECNLWSAYFSSDFKGRFEAGQGLLDAVMTDGASPAWVSGPAMMNLAWALINNREALVSYGIFVDEAAIWSAATTYFNACINTPEYENVWAGQLWKSCNEGLAWLNTNQPAPSPAKALSLRNSKCLVAGVTTAPAAERPAINVKPIGMVPVPPDRTSIAGTDILSMTARSNMP